MRKYLLTILLFCFFTPNAYALNPPELDFPAGGTFQGAHTLTLSGAKPEGLILSVTAMFLPMTGTRVSAYKQEIFTAQSDEYSITIPTQLFHPEREYRLANITVRAKFGSFEQGLKPGPNVFQLAFVSKEGFERAPTFRESVLSDDFPAELDLMCVERSVFMGADMGYASLIACDYEGKKGQSSILPTASLNKDVKMTLNFILTGQKNLDEVAQ